MSKNQKMTSGCKSYNPKMSKTHWKQSDMHHRYVALFLMDIAVTLLLLHTAPIPLPQLLVQVGQTEDAWEENRPDWSRHLNIFAIFVPGWLVLE